MLLIEYNHINMYCKAITKIGAPCISHCKKGSSYCVSHTKKYDECDICMNDMVNSVNLECGHSLCSNCVLQIQHDSDVKCPFCRHYDETYRKRNQYIINKLYNMSEGLSDLPLLPKIELSHKIFSYTLRHHTHLFYSNGNPQFVPILESKMKDFNDKMDCSRYLKQLDSFKNRISFF